MNQKLLNSPLFNATFVTVMWALQIFAAKLGLSTGVEVVAFMFHSYLASLIFLSVYGIFAGTWRDVKNLSRKAFWVLAAASAIVVIFGGLFFNAGVKLTTAVNVGFLSQFTTVVTILLAFLILKEKLDLSKIVTVLMIILGTFLLITNGKMITPHLGDVLILISGIAWSTANVLIRGSLKNTAVPPDTASLLRPISGLPIALILILFARFYPEPLKTFFSVDLLDFTFWQYAMLNGFLLAVLWIVINRTLKLASASYMAIFASMTPVLVAVLAIPLLGESISAIQMVGALLIVASGYASHYLKFHEH